MKYNRTYLMHGSERADGVVCAPVQHGLQRGTVGAGFEQGVVPGTQRQLVVEPALGGQGDQHGAVRNRNGVARSGKGVAVRTNAERIRTAAKPFRLKPEYGQEELWAGNVNYVDLLKERLRVNMIDRFWYKHMAFAWEREFRLAVSARMAEEFGVQVTEHGVKVEFEVPQLIERIFLGPSLRDADTEAIRHAAKAHDLEDRIRVSSMLGTPRYT